MPGCLSDEQRDAAKSSKTRLTIIAPPGCGKTEVLAHRVAYIIDRLEPGQEILALTFTNRAKANLMDRLRQTLGVARARRYVSVQNFHGHAMGIILAHGRSIGLVPSELLLPKSYTLSRALAAVESDAAARAEAAELLAAAKRAPLKDAEVLDRLRQGSGPGQSLAIRIEEDRQSTYQLHYEDLLRHAQRILHIDTVAHLYQRHYGAVVVDEFQDMSLQQLDLAQRSSAASRTFAGDPAQGIFSWTGAAPVEVERHLRDECGFPIQLRESYRSSPRVLEMVGHVSQLTGQPPLVSARPETWPGRGCSARLLFHDREDEAQAVVELVRLITEDPEASVGVILRSSWRGTEITKALGVAGVPVRKWDLAVDDPDTIDFVRRISARLPLGASVADAKTACLAEIDPADVDSRELLLDAFEVFEQAEQSTIQAALRQLRVVDPKVPVGPGVHLLSAHKGKGQQFDWVVVVGLDQGHIPDFRAKDPAALNEELRVLVVMLSRARHGVVVTRSTYARGKKPPHRPWTPDPSPWWSVLRGQHERLEDVVAHCHRLNAMRH